MRWTDDLVEAGKVRGTEANFWYQLPQYKMMWMMVLVQEQMKELDSRCFDLRDVTQGARKPCRLTASMVKMWTVDTKEGKRSALWNEPIDRLSYVFVVSGLWKR